jgi:hypothetical protein
MKMTRRQSMSCLARHWPALLALFAITACVSHPPRFEPVRQEAPALDTNVYFYPTQGHTPTAQQQDRDKYECNGWAVQKTAFDPSLPNVPPHQRVRVVARSPPGASTAAGAVTGAVVGAAVSNPWHAGRGTLIGALAGAAIGGIADAERTAEVNHIEAQANANADAARTAAMEQKATEYRRAMTACLEGRGYSVR